MDAWKSRRQGSTACQDWAVFIVSSLKENEASTKIKNKIAKTEYFFSVHPPPSPSVPPSPPDDPENFSAAPPISERSYKGLLPPPSRGSHYYR